MDLTAIEAHKASALDALHRGQKPEAHRKYQDLIDIFERYPFKVDHLIALYFNTLLASIDQHETQQNEKYILRLIELFSSIESPSPISIEVALRLTQLLIYPIPQLTPGLAEELLDQAKRFTPYTHPHKDERFQADEPLRPNTIAQLSPEDSGILCYLIVSQAQSKDSLSQWMYRLYHRHINTPPCPPDTLKHLEEFATHYQNESYISAYLSLLSALEWAVDLAPLFAFEWSHGLSMIEQLLDIDRLSFHPRLPLERRLELTMKIHRQLALDLIDEGEAERLALHHWQMVIDTGERKLHMIESRETNHTIQGGDVETKAYVTLMICEGLMAQGAFEFTAHYLDPIANYARRRAYTNPNLCARIFWLQGTLSERRYDALNAQESYRAAVQHLAPNLFHLQRFEDCLILQYELIESLNEEGIKLAFKSFCDLLRLGNYPPALHRLELLRMTLCELRGHISHSSHAEITLYIELTASYFGDHAATLKSLEAARVLHHRSGVALSLLYACLYEEQAIVDDPARLQRVMTEYRRAVTEARYAGGSNIQRQLQLSSVLLTLRHEMKMDFHESDTAERALEARFDQLLGDISQSVLSDLSGEFDLLLPVNGNADLEHMVSALIHHGRAMVARQVCAVLRQLGKRFFYVSPHREFSQKIKQLHQERFITRWVTRHSLPAKFFKTYDLLMNRKDTARWAQRTLSPREYRLEFRVFDQWIAAFLINSQQVVQVRKLECTAIQLRSMVDELREFLRPGGEDQHLLNEIATQLHALLIEPFEPAISHAHRLLITPDGPLYSLPFCLLRSRNKSYLAERMELVITCPTSSPVFPAIPPKDIPTFYAVGDPSCKETCQRLASLIGHDGFHEMDYHAPQAFRELKLDSHRVGVHTLYLHAKLSQDSRLHFGPSEDPLSIGEVIHSLANLNAVCGVLHGPVDVQHSQAMLRTLLTALHGGLLVRQWRSDYDQNFLLNFFRRAAETYQPIGLIEALSSARRTAIHERRKPSEWASFEFFISEGQ